MKSGLEKILLQIENACIRAKRDCNEVVLVAVSKKQSIEKIKDLYEEGQRIFAENYVQEFLEKKENLKKLDIIWHMIGPLQTNKVSKVVGEVECIHSVDSLKLAKKISTVAIEKNMQQKIFVQVNLAQEDSKSGISREEIESFMTSCSGEKGIVIQGFMSMPPLADNAESSRKYFKELKKIQIELKKNYPRLEFLSMGTTQDFEVAIEEGATHIRVGEAVFGKRK